MERDSLLYRMRRKLQTAAYSVCSKEFLTKLYYRVVIGGRLDLKNPQKFNEKIQWCKLYYFPTDPLVVQGADKFAAREYVKAKGLENILTKHFGSWEDPEDIPWEELPKQFILKCNHGCAYNILCPDKEQLDIPKTKQKLRGWLKEDFGKFNVEPHYSKIEKRVVFCEEFLGDIIDDCKFFCFNGEPKFIYIARGMIDDRNAKLGFYDLDGTKIPVERDDYADMGAIEFPEFFDEMLENARILSQDFPFVRVDYFMANQTYYFAELTFAPGAGMMPLKPEKFDVEWGKMLDIHEIMERHSDGAGRRR